MLAHTHRTNSFSVEVIRNKGTNRNEIKFLSRPYYEHFVNKLLVGDKLSLSLTLNKPRRTENQNRYLWAYYTHIALETGHEPEEIHEWAKTKCLSSTIKEVFGDKVRMKKSTTDLSVSDFIEYVMKIEVETGIVMPPLINYGLEIKQ